MRRSLAPVCLAHSVQDSLAVGQPLTQHVSTFALAQELGCGGNEAIEPAASSGGAPSVRSFTLTSHCGLLSRTRGAFTRAQKSLRGGRNIASRGAAAVSDGCPSPAAGTPLPPAGAHFAEADAGTSGLKCTARRLI